MVDRENKEIKNVFMSGTTFNIPDVKYDEAQLLHTKNFYCMYSIFPQSWLNRYAKYFDDSNIDIESSAFKITSDNSSCKIYPSLKTQLFGFKKEMTQEVVDNQADYDDDN